MQWNGLNSTYVEGNLNQDKVLKIVKSKKEEKVPWKYPGPGKEIVQPK